MGSGITKLRRKLTKKKGDGGRVKSLTGKSKTKSDPIIEDFKDPVFGEQGIFIWGKICEFLSFEFIVYHLTLVCKGYNEALIFRTFDCVKLTTDLHKEEAKDFSQFVQNKFCMVSELNAVGFKYKKLSNLLIYKLPNLEAITCRLNTALLVKILPERPNIKKIETGLRGMNQYCDMLKGSSFQHLTLTDMDEGAPIQTILMNCPNLRVLELWNGWAKNYPTLTHHKMEVIKSRRSKDGSNHIEFRSKMSNHLSDYLPNLKELHDVSGNSMIRSSSLEVLSCQFFRMLNETIEGCPRLRSLVAYSTSIDSVRGQLDTIRNIELSKVKINDIPKFFENLIDLRTCVIRNVRVPEFPRDDNGDHIHLIGKKLKVLHLEVEHTFAAEDLSSLIQEFPVLHEFTFRFIPRKKLTYEEVNRVVETKKIDISHHENSTLGRLSIIEGYHKDYPIYYEIAMAKTFKQCRSLKTFVVITLPTKKRQKMPRRRFERGFHDDEFVWVCDRKVYTKRPKKKLKIADESKEKAEERRREKEKAEQKTIADKMNEMEENKDAIEEEEILRKAQMILKKKELNEFDEDILAQADEIMRHRKENMAKMHKKMRQRHRALSKVGPYPPVITNTLDFPEVHVEKEDMEKAFGTDVRERLGAQFKATDNWGALGNIVKSKSEDKAPEKDHLSLSLLGGSDDGSDFSSLIKTPLMSPAVSMNFTEEAERRQMNMGKSVELDFKNILGELSGVEEPKLSDSLSNENLVKLVKKRDKKKKKKKRRDLKSLTDLGHGKKKKNRKSDNPMLFLDKMAIPSEENSEGGSPLKSDDQSPESGNYTLMVTNSESSRASFNELNQLVQKEKEQQKEEMFGLLGDIVGDDSTAILNDNVTTNVVSSSVEHEKETKNEIDIENMFGGDVDVNLTEFDADLPNVEENLVDL